MSEQFAVRRLMEVKERHAWRDGHEGVRQPTEAPTTTSTCVKPADSANMTVPEDWMIPRQEAKRQKGVGPERRDACPRFQTNAKDDRNKAGKEHSQLQAGKELSPLQARTHTSSCGDVGGQATTYL